jgi:hypothetical protein
MAADSPDLVEQTFQDLLAAALATGRRPAHNTVLGPACQVAIDIVAREHPDAAPEHIVAAYDAYAIESLGTTPSIGLPDDDPLTARAAEYAAINALVAQLTITYPNVDPQTVTAIVRRIHADFHHHAIRDFIPQFVEQAAHRKLA